MRSPLADTTYVLPIRRAEPSDDDLSGYLEELSHAIRVVVVDGSPPDVFAVHAAAWPKDIIHVPVDADRRDDLNGKVAGVVTGLRRVKGPKAIVADDDVRYDRFALRRLVALLDHADVVRPQNVFTPRPWHALLDEGRSLIARATGGDWPGTLGIRMEVYRAAGGYDGNVLFENLELVRTLRAFGATEVVAHELFVERRPPTTQRYLTQRVRQAYDEFARPGRMAAQLAIAPLTMIAAARYGAARALGVLAAGAIVLAEVGRRRGGGTRVFSPLASAIAPLWVLERAATSWCALALRLTRGGVAYSNGRLRVAAHRESALRARVVRRDAAIEAGIPS